ncbi:hypothetical protein [Kineosporia sp. R_H_3]|uniref:hypothetical protein n=1 Tax=Kineosporia sp. R_H_3 TaxID=1961848 RepID=UPI000B4A59D8|nr:hypothetical protein [Kineosporia sp. R_H_3]
MTGAYGGVSDVVQPIEVLVTLTRREAVAVRRATGSLVLRILRWAAMVVVPSLAVGGLIGLETRAGGLVVGGACALTIAVTGFGPVVLRPWWEPWRSPRACGVGVPVRWVLGPDGLTLESELPSGFMPWRMVRDVRVAGPLLVLRQRRDRWCAGVPVAALGPGGAERVVAWWEAGRSRAASVVGPVAQTDVPPEPVAVPDGSGDVVILRAPVTRSLARLLVWKDWVLQPVLSTVIPLGLMGVLVASIASHEPPASVGVVGSGLGLGLLAAGAVLGEVGARSAAARSAPPQSWRIGPASVGVAVADAWSHTPWSDVVVVVASPWGVLVRCRTPEHVHVVPTADLPAADVDRIVGWARAAGVPAADRRTLRTALAARRVTPDR